MVARNEATSITVAGVELMPTPAGFTVEITTQFPLTDLDIFVSVRTPQRVRTLVDSDNDGTRDMVVETPLKFHDVDGDGVIRPGDRIVLEPDRCEVVVPGTPLELGAEERLAACERIVHSLSGAGRSYPVSLLDPRGIR